MDKDTKERQGEAITDDAQALLDRRGFLIGLKKWSKIVIGGALAGSALLNPGSETEAAAWANRAGGGGGAWANRAGGGGAWANGGGGTWANRGSAWANRGSAWVNRF